MICVPVNLASRLIWYSFYNAFQRAEIRLLFMDLPFSWEINIAYFLFCLFEVFIGAHPILQVLLSLVYLHVGILSPFVVCTHCVQLILLQLFLETYLTVVDRMLLSHLGFGLTFLIRHPTLLHRADWWRVRKAVVSGEFEDGRLHVETQLFRKRRWYAIV